MKTPFPGMDPYLEHPVLWTGMHLGMVVEISKAVAAALRPRYVVSIEERLVFEDPLEPIREHYIEVLDRYQDMRVVTVVEMISPSNKTPGHGARDSYVATQNATLAGDVHLVEIDLLRKGRRVFAVPQEHIERTTPFDYLIRVNRAPKRNRFEFYPIGLRDRLPRFRIPLAEGDPDVLLDLQTAFEQVYEDGSYMLRVKYDEPCEPPLGEEHQQWANEQWRAYRSSHPEWFGSVE